MKTNNKIFALGFFDGVHLGHQALLRECRGLAQRLGCETAAITFEKHPKSLFCTRVPQLISAARDRQRLLRQYGIHHICTYPVTPESMGMPWRDFLEELLEYGGSGFVCGDDFRFGCRGEGTVEKLKNFCRERELPCIVVPEQLLDGVRISSSHIRQLVEDGKMESATKFLGHPYVLTGTVVHGHQLGRRLGVPTANLQLPEELAAPKFGVYVSRAVIGGQSYPAVTNVGTRPTVSGQGVTVEAWVLDFEGDLYGQEITLEFSRFLRPEMKFSDLTGLQRQIRADADETRAYFGRAGYEDTAD